jgi:iron complex transport system ATP-binding protein
LTIVELADVSIVRQGRPTVSNINFSVETGEQWALIGPNGAGKSTILSLCATATLPSKGDVRIFGMKVGAVELTEIKKDIGYVSVHHQLEWPMTARDVVMTAFTNSIETPMRWFPTQDQVEATEVQLERFGLTSAAETLWRGLSQGELGRAFLARAALMEPKLLLLDEPAAGLDLAAREQLLEVISQINGVCIEKYRQPLTSILVAHHLEELPKSTTHAALVSNGQIVQQGPIKQVLTSENLSTLFGLALVVEKRDGRWLTRSAQS